jgi:hypothetical protein
MMDPLLMHWSGNRIGSSRNDRKGNRLCICCRSAYSLALPVAVAAACCARAAEGLAAPGMRALGRPPAAAWGDRRIGQIDQPSRIFAPEHLGKGCRVQAIHVGGAVTDDRQAKFHPAEASRSC